MPGIFVKEIWPVEGVRTPIYPLGYFIYIVGKISKIDLVEPSAKADGAVDGWSTPIVQASPSVYCAWKRSDKSMLTSRQLSSITWWC